LRNNAGLLRDNGRLSDNNGRDMEEKYFSSISESVIYKGTLRDLWKMEEDLTKKIESN
jgi:hypothetical protein